MLLFLLPPSEGKQSGGQMRDESLHLGFSKPLDIAYQATEKDLKCTGKRYEEGISMNQNIANSPTLLAIERYSGVMYNAIDYAHMDIVAQQYFNEHTLILSGMYGLLQPRDKIGNYKLPIQTKGLYQFWKEQDITTVLIQYAKQHNATLIDLLPQSYKKMLDWKYIEQAHIPYTPLNFYQKQANELKKYTHGVKKVKGAWLYQQCKQKIASIKDLGGIHKNNEIQIIV